MHTFHVLEFLFLSFAPGRDGPIRYFGRSELHGISFFNFSRQWWQDFWNIRRFLEHAMILGTCLTLNFVDKSTLQEFVFMKFVDVSSSFCSDFLWS